MNPPTSKDEAISVVHEPDAELLAIEFEHVPFIVRRVFVVSRSGDSRVRGNHFAGCNQKLVLLSGRVDLNLARAGIVDSKIFLREIGSSADIARGDFVSYELLDPHAQIMVLADQSYEHSLSVREEFR